MYLIDADALEKDGWYMNRIVQINEKITESQTRKPTDFPTIEPHPEQKYTNKELRVFMHGISMRLLSLRSAQHWKYDDETAEEIKFLERLYKKVESEVTQ